MNQDVQIVLCTAPDAACAEHLARRVVEGGLAACVNIVPHVRSIYAWQGKIESDDELLLVIKTVAARYAELERALIEAHPYDTPEVLAVTVNGGAAAYLDWVRALTRP